MASTATSHPRLPPALGDRVDIMPVVNWLRPQIVESLVQIDADRRLPQALVDSMFEAGLFKTIHPRELGGLELHPVDYLDLIYELARINGSVAWIAHFQNGSLPLLPVAIAEELREKAGGRLLFAGSHARIGTAMRVQGGYRFSGTYYFASGSPWASYLTAYARIVGPDGEPELDPTTQAPVLIDGIIPRDETTSMNDWDTFGLRGTGSNGFTVDDVFVEERFTTDGMPPPEYMDRPILANLWETATAAVYLGSAQGAMDRFIELTHRPNQRVDHSADQVNRIQLAEAEAIIDSTKAWVWEVTERALEPDSADSLGSLPPDDAQSKMSPIDDFMSIERLSPVVRMTQAVVHAGRVSKRAMNLIFDMAGSDAVRVDRGIERYLRDLYTAAQHTGSHQRNLAMRGEYLLTKDNPDGPTITIPDALI